MSVATGRLAPLAKAVLPPALVPLVRAMTGRGIRFTGNYRTWEAATEAAAGYEDRSVVEAAVRAGEAVLRGKASWDRDGVAFERPEVPTAVLAAVLLAAGLRPGPVGVLDFGGGTGSTYRQVRRCLPGSVHLRWGVVDLDAVVSEGMRRFSGPELSFHGEIEACSRAVRPRLVLLSSVLQYLESPESVLEPLARTGAPYLLVDRTPVTEGKGRVVVQRVGADICRASFACRLFGEGEVEDLLARHYEVVGTFPAVDGVHYQGWKRIEYRGWLGRLREER